MVNVRYHLEGANYISYHVMGVYVPIKRTDILDVLSTLSDNGSITTKGDLVKLVQVFYSPSNMRGKLVTFGAENFARLVKENGGVVPQVVVKKPGGFEAFRGKSEFIRAEERVI